MESAQHREVQSGEVGPRQSKMEKNVLAFDNAIAWIKVAQDDFVALEQIVKDAAKALDDINIRDLKKALASIPKA